MKKILSFSLVICLLLSSLIFTASAINVTEKDTVISTDPINADFNYMVDYIDFGDRAIVLGCDKDYKYDVYTTKNGIDYTRLNIDLYSIIVNALGNPKDADTYVYFNGIYDVGNNIVVVAEYAPAWDEETENMYTTPVSICIENAFDSNFTYTVKVFDPFSAFFHIGPSVMASSNGNVMIIAADNCDFNSNEYAYYYTSTDGKNWTTSKSIPYDSNYISTFTWSFLGICSDGTAVFKCYIYEPSMTGGPVIGYYCTSDYKTYTEIDSDLYQTASPDSTYVSLSPILYYSNKTDVPVYAFRFDTDYSSFENVTYKFSILTAASVAGDWEVMYGYGNSISYYHWFITDNKCVVLLNMSDEEGKSVTKILTWDCGSKNITVSDSIDGIYADNIMGATSINGGGKQTLVYSVDGDDHDKLMIFSDLLGSGVTMIPMPKNAASIKAAILDVVLFTGTEGGYVYCPAKNIADTVKKPLIIPGTGDVTGDNKISLLDVSSLLKKIAMWDVSVNTSIADVNGDGSINLLDASALLKHIAGWN